MQLCIRTRNGETIAKKAYNTIRETVRLLVDERFPEDDTTILHPPIDPKAKHMTKGYSYYKKYYHSVYQELINDIEMNEPLVALCANQWKAKILVRQIFQARVDLAAKKRRAEGDHSPPRSKAAKRRRIGNKNAQRSSNFGLGAPCDLLTQGVQNHQSPLTPTLTQMTATATTTT